MNKELMEALDILEKEKEISKETLFEAIENSLITACKNHFGKSDNIKVEIDNLPVAESRKKGFGVAQDRGQVVLNGRRKTAVYVAL